MANRTQTRLIGAKPRTEFVDCIPRRPARRPESSSPVTNGLVSPNRLSVGRTANAETTSYRNEWDNYLRSLGADNRHFGTALTLGRVGITYVSEDQMNSMLVDRYARDFRDNKRRANLFRQINAGLTAFIRSECQIAFDQQTEQVANEYHERCEGWNAEDEVNGLFRELGMEEDLAPESIATLTVEDQIKLETHRFGPTNLSVRDLDFYPQQGYGLDLSGNGVVHEEYHLIVGHLKKDAKLATRLLDSGKWKAQAPAFSLYEHVPIPDSLVTNGIMPSELAFLPPKTVPVGL